ncbi:Serine/threonine-protein kinase PKH2 [Wickerhamiella sorbophila]|uniref:non-specific serine/threonine protein kinase n=1 Tax=Wickerhamiella sorbophila TaxID=45607 RepID=A0A2T0FN67_9ASCO|nr:Serine/threonine-protein kinase PKH2 [Wickerhamiella sorbophila]PRT56409.1 Serine/threonine-protein kinase PKH2 [Wickerhamiella sorbophila]
MSSRTHHGVETNGIDDLGRAIESSLSFDQQEQSHDLWQHHNTQQPFYSRSTAVYQDAQSPSRADNLASRASPPKLRSPVSSSGRPRAYSGTSPNHHQQAPAPSGTSLSPRQMAYRLPHNPPLSLAGEPVGPALAHLAEPVRVSPPARLGSPIAEATPPLHERSQASPGGPTHVPVRHSDGWNQEGAATLVKKTTDEQGNVTTRVIKKGVEDFEFKEELGTGSYSTVVAASDKQTLRQYAIKILDKAHIIKEGKVKYVEIEKNTLTRLGDHPGIIHLYYTFQDRASLFFVLDFAPNGELLQLIKRMGSINEEGARYYAAQLLDAIDYMHSKGVIHRDLKPENILLDYKMRIKITDFGTAKLLEANPATNEYPIDSCRADSFVGTAEYVSPELLSQKTQGKSADIWAFGCVLFQMIAGNPPFQGSTQYLTFQRIVKYQWTAPPGFPVLVRDLLKNVFVGPRRRLEVDEIKAHPFFESQDWSPRELWNSSPPRLVPYKPSPQSLASSRLPKVRSQPVRRPVAPRPSPAMIPTPAGLAPVQPSTRAGVPSNANLRSGDGVAISPRAPALPGRPVSASSAAAAALSRSAASPRTPRATAPQSHTQSYQQSQERLQELTRRVRERTNQRPASGGPSLHVNTQRRSTPPLQKPVMSSPNLGGYSPSSPKSPSLPLPNLTATEGEWSTVLISSQERILRIGKVTVYAGNNIGLSECTSTVETEHRVAKLMSSRHKRTWTLMVTTAGRMVVIGSDRKVRVEVPLGVPQVEIQIVSFVKRDGSVLAVETYNRAIVISDDKGNVKDWMSTIELSRRYYAQATAEQERNAFSAAAAAACAVSGTRR